MDIALGLDGYMLLFVVHDQHIFGQEVLKAIYIYIYIFFLYTTKLLLKKKKPLKEVIATIITLVAMVPNPKRMGGL